MFLPFGTDRPTRRPPLVTPIVIGANLLTLIAVLALARQPGWNANEIMNFGALDTSRPWRLWTYVTSMFLHDTNGLSHIVFNMLFLWVFGCAVEDRLGRWLFAAFYLAGGIASAVAQWGISEALGEHSLVVGASGAVMAVTGAFVAFFPRARVRVLLIFIFIGVYWMPAMLVVGIFFALDIIGQITNALGMRTSNTAFAAHLGGSIFGFATAFGLLATGLLKRDDFDIFYLFKQSRRRSAMRAAVGQTAAGPWATAQADTPERLAKQAKKPVKPAPPGEPPEVRAARAAIMQLLKAHDPSAAARKYAELLREHSKITFAVNQQLDLASALFAESLFAAAAIAYELYLMRYPNDRRRNETMLLLALLYTRKEQNPERARELIDLASARMRDPEHIALLDALRCELSDQ